MNQRIHRAASRRGHRIGRPALFIGIAISGLLAAACSSGSANQAAPSTSSSGSTAIVKVVSDPHLGHILETGGGLALYTLGTDQGSQSSCSGGCATAWPPVTVSSSSTSLDVHGLKGTLVAVKQADGTYQITFNGHPLYTFASDSPGQATGDGVAGFSLVKVSTASAASTPTTSAPARSGY